MLITLRSLITPRIFLLHPYFCRCFVLFSISVCLFDFCACKFVFIYYNTGCPRMIGTVFVKKYSKYKTKSNPDFNICNIRVDILFNWLHQEISCCSEVPWYIIESQWIVVQFHLEQTLYRLAWFEPVVSFHYLPLKTKSV